ncbi:MAG: hypothetical protein H7328_00490 [Bdellovibrio sp.]|nr:hypothetical protein [Bdellovibrio sp.]
MDILSSLLSGKTAKQNDFKKVLWLLSVMKWLQRPRNAEEKDSKKETVYTVRIKYLLLILDKNPEWKNNFIETISGVLFKISSISQFSTVGLSNSSSFVQDFIYRLQEKVLPKTPLTEDLSTLVHEIFPHEDESEFIDFIEESVLIDLVNLFQNEIALHNRLTTDILSASYVLSVQVLSTVFSVQNELNDFSVKPENLPEFQIEGILRRHQETLDFNIPLSILSQIDLAEKNIDQLHESMKSRGVKIELVYMFENQKRKLRRLRILLSFLTPSASNAVVIRYFISNLVLDVYHQKSLRSFLTENLALLTERIVQANSHLGEHYVTFTWSEFRKMFRSAVGGGAITVLTVFIKTFTTKVHFTGFIKGFTDSLNYSGSFLIIQILGGTLATKQPSATAPYIASALTKSIVEARKSIVALLRTQFIAVLGNLSSVFPICFIISLLAFKSGHSILTDEEVMTTFFSTNILGPSALFAVFTGCLLFSASLIAGWFENWVITTRLSNRMMNSEFLHKRLGEKRTHSFANFVGDNSNSLAANISLGFLLGLLPQIIKFFGIPLEVRHITLATGSFATSLPQALELGVSAWDLVNSVAGILVIGLINISVSFSLAFLVASASSKVRFSSFMKLLKWGLYLIVTRPWLLLVPEKETVPAEPKNH